MGKITRIFFKGVVKKTIIKYLFKRFLRKHQNKEVKKEYKSYNNIKTVLILFESDLKEKNEVIKKIISELSNDGKQVDAIGYAKKKHIHTIIRPNFKILSKKDINWVGKPTASILKKTEMKKYDLLIDLNVNRKVPLLYLNVASNSLLKTGLYNKKYDLFDFSIHKKKLSKNKKELEIIEIFQQITFYLKKIEAK